MIDGIKLLHICIIFDKLILYLNLYIYINDVEITFQIKKLFRRIKICFQAFGLHCIYRSFSVDLFVLRKFWPIAIASDFSLEKMLNSTNNSFFKVKIYHTYRSASIWTWGCAMWKIQCAFYVNSEYRLHLSLYVCSMLHVSHLCYYISMKLFLLEL